jgi:hypothetical protein
VRVEVERVDIARARATELHPKKRSAREPELARAVGRRSRRASSVD